MTDYSEDAARVTEELLARIGEATPQPRLEPTRRVVDLLGDPQRAYPIIHVTGTNGKTTTSRIAESILRAYGLRTGLMTSPHLVRINERIVIDGEPISDEKLVENWDDIQPYLLMVDTELEAAGEAPLTYFEALTALAFAAFADAPVDVAVIEVGMGGEWDSTNVADGQVAVLAPIALDHTHRLGSTIEEIARTKSGIIKPLAEVVTALQDPEAFAEIERAAELTESTVFAEGAAFELESAEVAVGGQAITVRGLAGRYADLYLPLYGDHQGHNAALAIAAVEAFLGRGTQALVPEVLADGLARVTSPGRLQIIASDPAVIVDAAHNPHGAHSLAEALSRYFDFDEVAFVVGILADKDAAGVVAELAPVASRWFPTASGSDRALPAEEIAELLAETGIEQEEPLPIAEALRAAQEWAREAPRRAVVIAGSITLVGEVLAMTGTL
ncbi:MAG: bifunctional folylpolyglutamate synthase/dihydrofolate synthase [Microbacteriaceae bacterium]|nr:bifunctional folylpolyglutamate synthase/dihydrofolate synthase [Microbacteriaceae bacterium]